MVDAVNERFSPGVFSPAPQRSSVSTMMWAQGKIETKLFLRHGEQQLLSLIIPLGLLIGIAKIPFLGVEDPLTQGFPMMLAIAVTSSGFTGQAIALAFDRRYGALKRTGASGVPAWAIIAGKVIAVAAMVIFQVLVLGATAYLLGWPASGSGVLMGLVILLVGVACFTSLGLLFGGSLSSEIVLAGANLLWVVLVAVTGWVLYEFGLTDSTWFDLIPSVALASGLAQAFEGVVPWSQALILLVWTVFIAGACTRFFKFAG